jgi:hypothetical protein
VLVPKGELYQSCRAGALHGFEGYRVSIGKSSVLGWERGANTGKKIYNEVTYFLAILNSL